MPSVRLQILRFDAAEGQEEHGKYEQRLQDRDSSAQKRPGPVYGFGQYIIYKVNGCSRHHRDGKHPFSYCFPDIHLLFIEFSRILVVKASKAEVIAMTGCEHAFM